MGLEDSIKEKAIDDRYKKAVNQITSMREEDLNNLWKPGHHKLKFKYGETNE